MQYISSYFCKQFYEYLCEKIALKISRFSPVPYWDHESKKKRLLPKFATAVFGGEKGIRTLVTVPRKHDFQSCALDQLSHLSGSRKANFITRI